MLHLIYIESDREEWQLQLREFLQDVEEFEVTERSRMAQVVLRVFESGPGGASPVLVIEAKEERVELPFVSVTRATLVSLLLMIYGSHDGDFEQSDYYGLMHKMSRVVAHDIRNPLNNILLSTAQFKLDALPEPDEVATYIEIIERSCDRISKLADDISEPLMEQSLSGEPVSIDLLVKKAIGEVEDRLELNDIQLEQVLHGAGQVIADEQKMVNALAAVLENAIESIGKDGQISIGGAPDGAHYYTLIIRDSGKGIADEVLPRVFQPFFTTRDRKRGLGLAYAKKVIAAHGGNIALGNEEKPGAFCKITLKLIE